MALWPARLQKPLGRFRPVGHTDSEYLFCLLLAEMERFANLAHEIEYARQLGRHAESPFERPEPLHTAGAGRPAHSEGHLETEQQWQWLHRFLLHLNDFGRLNCILSDGVRLVVYHDKHRWKGLTYRHVFLHVDSPQHFSDATVAVQLHAEPVNHGCIVATNPLIWKDGSNSCRAR